MIRFFHQIRSSRAPRIRGPRIRTHRCKKSEQIRRFWWDFWSVSWFLERWGSGNLSVINRGVSGWSVAPQQCSGVTLEPSSLLREMSVALFLPESSGCLLVPSPSWFLAHSGRNSDTAISPLNISVKRCSNLQMWLVFCDYSSRLRLELRVRVRCCDWCVQDDRDPC